MSQEKSSPLVGSCHCGKVRVTLPSDATGVVACHCADCQKLHGNFFAMFVADQAVVRWEGEGEIRWYRSSSDKERGFCGHCGSRIAKRSVNGTRLMISVGLFERTLPHKVVKHLWAESAPGWYEVPRLGPLTPEAFVEMALRDPLESPVAQYGYSLRAASGNSRPPGVIALTWIQAKNAEERERIRAHSKQNVQDFLAEPGFLSIVTGFTGLRGFTVTAWEDEAAMKRALGKHHQIAMKELFGENFVAAVWTSVWTPTRMNRLWLRCPSCGSLEDQTTEHPECKKCSSNMGSRPAFW